MATFDDRLLKCVKVSTVHRTDFAYSKQILCCTPQTSQYNSPSVPCVLFYPSFAKGDQDGIILIYCKAKNISMQLSIYVFIIANMSVFFSEETCSNSFKNVFNLKIVVTCFWNVDSIRFRVCVYVFLCTFFRIELERM